MSLFPKAFFESVNGLMLKSIEPYSFSKDALENEDT